ncbi:E3 binding domain-containing protein, partial [bacterium]|nr:E3 binding domain-containing protein [bacterium]
MAVEIKIPSVGESVAEGEIAEWLKAEGDAVEQDEPLVVIETDKITIDLPAPASGTLSRITKKAGSVVQVGDVIGYIEEAGEAPKKDRKEKAEPEKAAAKAAEKPAAKKAEEKPAPKREPEPDEAEGGEEPALSPAVRRLVEESGVDPARVEGSGKGGRILKSDVEEYIESRGETAETEKPAPKATPAD